MDPERKKTLTSRPLPMPPSKSKQRPASMYSQSCPADMQFSVKKAALAFFKALESGTKKDSLASSSETMQSPIASSSTLRSSSTKGPILAARRKSSHQRKRSKSTNDLLEELQQGSRSATSPIDPRHPFQPYGIQSEPCSVDINGDDDVFGSSGVNSSDSIGLSARINSSSNLLGSSSTPFEGSETLCLRKKAKKKKESLEELQRRMEEEQKEYLATIGALALREEQKKK